MNYNEILANMNENNYKESCLQLVDMIKERDNSINTLTELNNDMNTKITDLQNTNQKLFLRATTTFNPNNESQETNYDNLISERIKGGL